MNSTPTSSLKIAGLALVLVCGLGIRLCNLPGRFQLRDSDEIGYLSAGLLLWEGLAPATKMTPSGSLTWMEWAYAGGASLRCLVADGRDSSVPRAIRPFMAVDHALFDTYRDLSRLRKIALAAILLGSLAGMWAAFQLGYLRAGLPGGLVAGGLMAMLPAFVSVSGMVKPYMLAWSYAVLACYFAASKQGLAQVAWAAVFTGLTVADRIDMLQFVPVVMWILWQNRDPSRFAMRLLGFLGMAASVALLVSPWLLTGLVGNLRLIVQYRFVVPAVGVTWPDTLMEFVCLQGLGPVWLALVGGLVLAPRPIRSAYWIGAGIVLLLTAGMVKATGFGLRHQGSLLVAMVVLTPYALSRLQQSRPGVATGLACLLLMLPSFNAVSSVRAERRAYVPDEATGWVEKNIPVGTVVYLSPTFHDPLPTRASADALWDQVSDRAACRAKVRRGLQVLDVPEEFVPRALSEEILCQERGVKRRWFVLGGRWDPNAPRYDIRILGGGSAFELRYPEALEQFRETGGVFIHRGAGPIERDQLSAGFDRPRVSWIDESGVGTYVYAAPSRGRDP